jgi:hypothetical protein
MDKDEHLDEESIRSRLMIGQLLFRYALGVDTKDEELLRSCFADQLSVEGRAPGPMQRLFDLRAPETTGAEYAANVTASMRLKGATQHVISNPAIELLDDRRAVCRAYLRAIHFALDRPTGSSYEVGGYYQHDLVLEGSSWKIRVWRLVLTWEFGDFTVMGYPWT